MKGKTKIPKQEQYTYFNCGTVWKHLSRTSTQLVGVNTGKKKKILLPRMLPLTLAAIDFTPRRRGGRGE